MKMFYSIFRIIVLWLFLAIHGISQTNEQFWIVEAENLEICKVEGKYSINVYPRTIDSKVIYLSKGSKLTTSANFKTVCLRLPIVFNLPGPDYGNLIETKLRYKIDNQSWQEISMANSQREIQIAEFQEPGDHTIVIEPVSDYCAIDGFRFSKSSLSCIYGEITSNNYSELLVNVRADIFQTPNKVRSEYIRSNHNSKFEIFGLEPGIYKIRFTASGWESLEISEVAIKEARQKINLGTLILRFPFDLSFGPKASSSINIQSGQSFTTKIALPGEVKNAQLVSKFKTVNLKINDIKKLEFGQWNNVSVATFQVPDGIPYDMYDLKIICTNRTLLLSRAVCVREPLPSNFHIAGVGHMNTWGQETSEYLAKVAELIELAGARTFLISNEVNAAYVYGALMNLRIPYLVTSGNHTMARWKDFFGPNSIACDDGPMCIVTFGDYPYQSWNEVKYLINSKPDATNRILLCYEGIAPIDLIREGKVDLLFDGHSDDPHPNLTEFPAGTLHFRAPGQHSFRWISMTHQGFADSIHTLNDVPFFTIPRKGSLPLRIDFSNPNDGSSDKLIAQITNEYKQNFPNGKIRFILKAGNYQITGGKILQKFDSDDSKYHIIDVEVNIPKSSTISVTAK